MKVETLSCEVLEHTWVNARYKYLRLRAPAPLARRTAAGQFFQLACPVVGDEKPFLRRPMSVYGIGPEDERIEFLYHVKGTGTRALDSLRPGEALAVIGPLGKGFSFSAKWRRVLLVARGVGLATMAPLVPLAARAGVAITAVLSARSPADLMRAEFLRGAEADVHSVFDTDGSSAVARVEPLIARLVAEQRPDMVYTCGSNRLLELLQRLGVQGEVALEQQMACAMGVCLSCVRLFNEGHDKVFRRVCCEGPVFPLGSVAGEVQFG
ncbi:MAG: dihydroorotate dehydrogenase electron transfer subunit [Betaproteobacteria bacterium]